MLECFDQLVKNNMKHMTALKTLPLFKDMITQLVTY